VFHEHPRHRDLFASRRDATQRPQMRAACAPARHHHLSFRDLIFHRELDIREGGAVESEKLPRDVEAAVDIEVIGIVDADLGVPARRGPYCPYSRPLR
jgi:hypothetical protein